VAARCPEVSAIALYEPTLMEFADERFMSSVFEGLGRVGEMAEQGRCTEGVTTFFTDVAAELETFFDTALQPA
jgi:hypothetical protein